MRKSASIVVLAAALCLASAAVAQTVIETKVKSGTVIGKTDHSVVIKMDDGVVREFEVPPGRTATVDGKEVGLADLKIGTTLSATFKTVAKPVEVKTMTIKDGEVVKVSGANLTTKEKDGFHNYVVPKGFKFLVDGKETGIENLGPGMKLNATIVTTSATMTTETKREGVSGKAPAEPTPVVAAAPAGGARRRRAPRRAAAAAREARRAEARPARPPRPPRSRAGHHGSRRSPGSGSDTRAARRLLAHDDDRHRPHRAASPDRARDSRDEEGRIGPWKRRAGGPHAAGSAPRPRELRLALHFELFQLLLSVSTIPASFASGASGPSCSFALSTDAARPWRAASRSRRRRPGPRGPSPTSSRERAPREGASRRPLLDAGTSRMSW